MHGKSYQIGVDVGGTHTNGVIFCDKKPLGDHTLINSSDGSTQDILNIVSLLLADHNVLAEQLDYISIGTTRFINALTDEDNYHQNLAKVAIIRLCGPCSDAVDPHTAWPNETLASAVNGSTDLIGGGYEIDSREMTPLDLKALQAISDNITSSESLEKPITAVAITGSNSVMHPNQEIHAMQFLKERHPNLRFSLSHTIGETDLLSRENATILNAALLDYYYQFCNEVTAGLDKLLKNIKTIVYLSRSDGTVEPLAKPHEDSFHDNELVALPILSVKSGPINSLLGATLLTGIPNAIAVDCGGTTFDIGVIIKGRPLKVDTEDEDTGAPMNLHHPVISSVALGGGRIINLDAIEKPDNQFYGSYVGNKITERALCFGGTELTFTCLAMMHKKNLQFTQHTQSKEPKKTIPLQEWKTQPNPNLAKLAYTRIHKLIATEIKKKWRMLKTKPTHVVLVGGAASLCDCQLLATLLSSTNLTIITPDKFACSANAIGAVLTKFKQEVIEYCNPKKSLKESTDEAAAQIRRSVSLNDVAGIDLEVVASDLRRSPIPYSPQEKRTTTVLLNRPPSGNAKKRLIDLYDETYKPKSPHRDLKPVAHLNLTLLASDATKQPLRDVRLEINQDNLTELYDIARGAGVFGSCGGGHPKLALMMAVSALKRGKSIRIIPPNALENKEHVVVMSKFGNPVAGAEKIGSRNEGRIVIKLIEDLYGHKISAIAPLEAGGCNAIYPMTTSAELGLPMVDCDGGGRAWPHLKQFTYAFKGKFDRYLAAISDGQSYQTLDCESLEELDSAIQQTVKSMGAAVMIATLPMTAKQLKQTCVEDSISRAREIGACLRQVKSQTQQSSKIRLALAPLSKVIFTMPDYRPFDIICKGTIDEPPTRDDDEEDYTVNGYVVIKTKKGKRVALIYENESLYAIRVKKDNSQGKTLVKAPNIISLLHRETLEPIYVERMRFGTPVIAITLNAPKPLRKKKAQKIVGHKAFPFSWPLGSKPVDESTSNPKTTGKDTMTAANLGNPN